MQVAGQKTGNQVIAEILRQEKPRLDIAGEDGRRRKPPLAQGVGETGKGDQVGPGQPGHGIIAQRRALIRAGIRRTHRRFGSGRRVHQHGPLPAALQPDIAPR